jgi:uncharacterized protein YoxC
MSKSEVSSRFQKGEKGVLDYQGANLQRISLIHTLLEIGLGSKVLKLLEDRVQSKDEQISILKKQRFQLLEDIHRKQQSLDQLDYIIHEIKNQKT